jgi:hypothetical protein
MTAAHVERHQRGPLKNLRVSRQFSLHSFSRARPFPVPDKAARHRDVCGTPVSSRPDFKCALRGTFDLRSPPVAFGTLVSSSPMRALGFERPTAADNCRA